MDQQSGTGFKEAAGFFWVPGICVAGDISVVSQGLIYNVVSTLALIQQGN